MKKTIFICAACITLVSMQAYSQNKNVPEESFSAKEQLSPPPPPLPPLPPTPPVESINSLPALPAPPPLPPLAPRAPLPPLPALESVSFSPVIINSIGYDVSLEQHKGKMAVMVKNNAFSKKIKLGTWLSQRKYYEKKYGILPPLLLS